MFSKYVGIPWKDSGRDGVLGVDCWGFVVYFYKDYFDIELNKYEGVSSLDTKDCSDFIVNSNTYELFEKVDSPEIGDIIMFNIGGEPLHVGIIVGESLMIHAHEVSGTVVESYENIRWKKRIEGFYRYVS